MSSLRVQNSSRYIKLKVDAHAFELPVNFLKGNEKTGVAFRKPSS